jgi:hypothetical protein
MAAKTNGTGSIEALQADLAAALADVERLTTAKQGAELDSERAMASNADDRTVAGIVATQRAVEFQLGRATARVEATRVAIEKAGEAALQALYAQGCREYEAGLASVAKQVASEIPAAAAALASILKTCRALDWTHGQLTRMKQEQLPNAPGVNAPPAAVIYALAEIVPKLEGAVNRLKLVAPKVAESDFQPSFDMARVVALRKVLAELHPPPAKPPDKPAMGAIGHSPRLAPPTPRDPKADAFVPVIGRGLGL